MAEDEFTPDQKRAFDLCHYPVRPHVGVGGVILWKNKVCLIKRKYNPNLFYIHILPVFLLIPGD